MASSSNYVTNKQTSDIPKIGIGILLAILAFGVFMIGFDQGEIVFGFHVPPDGAGIPSNNWAHEFYHDMRNAAGFPCH